MRQESTRQAPQYATSGTSEPGESHGPDSAESPAPPADPFGDLERAHPIAAEIARLALHHFQAGENAEAMALYKHALEITTAAAGDQHPTVATILEHYAQTLRAMNREAEAEPLEDRAQAILGGVTNSPPREYWLG